MSLSNRERAVLAVLDGVAGLNFPMAVWDADGERVLVSEQVTLLLDTASASTLHGLAAVLRAARAAPSPDPW